MNGENERAAKPPSMCGNAGCSGRANQSCMRLLCSLCCRKDGNVCRAHRSRSAHRVKHEDLQSLRPLTETWDQPAASSQGRQRLESFIPQVEASSQQNPLSRSELQALWDDDDILVEAVSPPNAAGFGNDTQAGRFGKEAQAGNFGIGERRDMFLMQQQPPRSLPPSDLGTDAYTISVGSSLIADLERDAKQKTQGVCSGGPQFYQQLDQVLSAGHGEEQGSYGMPSWLFANSHSAPPLSDPLSQYRLDFSKRSPLHGGAPAQQELLHPSRSFPQQPGTPPLSQGPPPLKQGLPPLIQGLPPLNHGLAQNATFDERQSSWPLGHGSYPQEASQSQGLSSPPATVCPLSAAGASSEWLTPQSASPGLENRSQAAKRSALSPSARKRAKKSPVKSPPQSSPSSPPTTPADIPSAPVLANLVAPESLPPASIPILLMQLKNLRASVPLPLQKQVLASNRPLQILADSLEAQKSAADVAGMRPDVSGEQPDCKQSPERAAQLVLTSARPLSAKEPSNAVPAPSLGGSFKQRMGEVPLPAEPLMEGGQIRSSEARSPRGGAPLLGIQAPHEMGSRSPRRGALLVEKVYPLPAEHQAGAKVFGRAPDQTAHSSVAILPTEIDSQTDELLLSIPTLAGEPVAKISPQAKLMTVKDAELQWSAAVGRKPDLDDDSALTTEESLVDRVDRAKHRLRETTQLMQQLLPAQPAALEGTSLQDREISVFLTARDAATWPDSSGRDARVAASGTGKLGFKTGAGDRKRGGGEHVMNEELAARLDELRRHVQRLEELPAGVEVLQQILSFDQAQTAGLGLTSEQLERRAASLQRKTPPRLPLTVGRPDRRKPHQVVTSFSDLI